MAEISALTQTLADEIVKLRAEREELLNELKRRYGPPDGTGEVWLEEFIQKFDPDYKEVWRKWAEEHLPPREEGSS